jgi:hypothetical protein
MAGVPNATVKFVSLSVLLLLGLIYYSVRVHTSGFGSYKQLLPVLALPVILANLMIVSAITLAIEIGKNNIFSAPEYSRRSGRQDLGSCRWPRDSHGRRTARPVGDRFADHAADQEVDRRQPQTGSAGA